MIRPSTASPRRGRGIMIRPSTFTYEEFHDAYEVVKTERLRKSVLSGDCGVCLFYASCLSQFDSVSLYIINNTCKCLAEKNSLSSICGIYTIYILIYNVCILPHHAPMQFFVLQLVQLTALFFLAVNCMCSKLHLFLLAVNCTCS